jgi:hypothetical protein
VDIQSDTEFAQAEAAAAYGGGEGEEFTGRCSAVLSNGKRCPNEALPGSRYCGLPAHQELALKETEDDVEPIVAESDPELEALADLAPPEAESIGPESLEDVPGEPSLAAPVLTQLGEPVAELDGGGPERAEPDEVPAGIPVERLSAEAEGEEHPPAA